MAILQFLLLFLMSSPFFRQRLVRRPALEDAAPALDEGRSHGFQQDAVGGGLHNAFGAVLDVELFPEPAWNNHLALGGKPNGVGFVCHAHDDYSYILTKVRQL